MKRTFLFVLVLLLSGLLISPVSRKGDKFSKAVFSRLSKGESQLVWVFFNDKGTIGPVNKTLAKSTLSDKTLKRRAKVRPSDRLVDEKDLPVSPRYIEAVRDLGVGIRNESRWFNAVSAWIDADDLMQLDALDFVSRIEPVAAFPKNKKMDESPVEDVPVFLEKSGSSYLDSASYGYAYQQLKQIRVPEVHQLGFYGQGVTIAVLDNGFRLLSHESFSSMNIVDMYDFVDKKEDVAPVNPSSGFGMHGINTLSVIGGFKKGKLIGPAFKADFLLARTENDSSETPLEEDNWIAAMEWAEAKGADIISSSLGYINFDSSGALTYDRSVYNWAWMNGDSTRITKAANLGVGMGLVIVNSAGNEGFNASHNTIGAPADGDSVIAAGAVDNLGLRAGFSSVGPTTLGRIKPDVMARGYAVSSASSLNATGYTLVNGTSFSCPLTAGVCALILSAHPGLTPAQVRWALKMTADNSSTPNNQYGYGIINALAAVSYFGITGTPDTTYQPDVYDNNLKQNGPNPFTDLTTVWYNIANPGKVKITVYNILGQRVTTLVNAHHAVKGGYSVTWNGKDDSNRAVASGLYFYRMEANGFSKTRKMLLVR